MITIHLSNAGAETLLQYALERGFKGTRDAKISKAIHDLVLKVREKHEAVQVR